MKKFLLTALCCAATLSLSAQAKKPTLMVIPSDMWCNTNGYMTAYDNQGSEILVPDYQRAIQSDVNLLPVIAKINDLMADRGFPLKNLESEIKSIRQNNAEMSMLQSKSGAEIVQNPIDELRQHAKADIIIQLSWTVNQTGPKKSITYTLAGARRLHQQTGGRRFGYGQPVVLGRGAPAARRGRRRPYGQLLRPSAGPFRRYVPERP